MFKIYLAGYINNKKFTECSGWRRKIAQHYNNYKGKGKYPIHWLDPMNGETAVTIKNDGLESDIPPKAILDKDYLAVSHADLIIANMSTFGENRPPIGTICELAWGWQLKKPIILITDNIWYKKHPFISNFVSWIVSDVDELLSKKIINLYFKAVSDAIY